MNRITQSIIIGFILLSFFGLSKADDDSSPAYFDKTPFKNSTMLILKVNWDTKGKYRLLLGNVQSSQRVNQSFSANIEVLFKEIEKARLGLGVQYHIPRSIKGHTGKFYFVPIYAHMVAYPFLENDFPYVIARIGYNLFQGDNDFKDDYNEDTSLTGGLYYAYGIGTAQKLNKGMILAELLLSYYKGKIDVPGSQYDVKYSRLLITLGYGFQ